MSTKASNVIMQTIMFLIVCSVVFFHGFMTGKHYEKKQRTEQWELVLSNVVHIDMPEETPPTGAKMIAYVISDTAYIEYDRDMPHQRLYHHFNWNE